MSTRNDEHAYFPVSFISPTSTEMATSICSGFSTMATCVICNFGSSNLKRLPCSHLACVSCLLGSWMNNERLGERSSSCRVCKFEFSVKVDADPFFPLVEHVADECVQSLKDSQAPHYECCSECRKSEVESDLLVCATCVMDKHGIDLCNGQFLGEGITLETLCGLCAIRTHLRQGCIILDYSPLRLSSQYQHYLKKQIEIRSKFELACCDVRASVKRLEDFLSETNQNLDIITEKTGTAESSQQQHGYHQEFELIAERMTKILSEMSVGIAESVNELAIDGRSLRSSATYPLPDRSFGYHSENSNSSAASSPKKFNDRNNFL